MRYELIREIFNQCSGNQMRDVFVSEIETDDPEAHLRAGLVGKEISVERIQTADGVIFEVITDGLHQRFSYTQD
ncbi:MAG: hypothetical protein E7472_03985 [Ruminococcaceae bacterium]|nr:hypothetical protein [Oscillospiraceae bacterium]